MRCFGLALLFLVYLVLPAHAGWSQPVRISEVGGGYYPQIIAQGDTLHVVYENSRGYDKIDYLRSSDGGATWSQHRVLSQNNELTLDPHIIRWNQRLMALWMAYLPNGPYHYNIAFATSNNNGLTWSAPQYVLNSNWEWPFSSAASGSDSLISIMAIWGYAGTRHFINIRSLYFGANWLTPRELFTAKEGGFPDQACQGGKIHFVWDGRFDLQHNMEIYYIQSGDGGIIWSNNIPLSDTDQYHSQLPAISCDSSGVVCIWMDYKYSPYIDTGDILLRQSNDSGFTWSSESQITFNHLAERPDIASCGDTLYVAWENYTSANGIESIYSTRSTNGGITWDEPYWVDGDTGWSYNPAIAASDGRAYLVWYDMQLPDSSGLYFSRYDPENDAVSEGGGNIIPKEISLSAYPNPFNSYTTISIKGPTNPVIAIFDIIGRKIAALQVDNGKAVWDATGFSSGIYFARVQAGNSTKSIKLVLLK